MTQASVDPDNPYAGQPRRYVLVHYVTDGDYYTLLSTNWGCYHFDDKDAALRAADDLRPSLKEKLGIEPHHIKVIHTECWGHGGDCCRTVFTPQYAEQNVVIQENSNGIQPR